MVAFYNQGDQDIYKSGQHFVPQEQYRLGYTAPVQGGGQDASTPSFGIPATQAFTNSGGGGGGENYSGGNFQQVVDARQNRLNKPIDTSTFMGKAKDFMNPQSANDIMTSGYQEPRFQPGIIATMLGKIDNFRNLPQADQAFISQNMGYTGPTVFGANNSGLGKDPFGINTRSAFGNYANYVDKMEADFSNIDEDAYGKLSDFDKKKVDFYRGKKKESEELKMQEELAAEEHARDIKNIQDRIETTPFDQEANIAGGGGGTTATHDYGTGKGEQTAQEAAQDNDPNTGSAQGHSQHYAKGGRTGYFFGGRTGFKNGGLASIL